MAANCQWYVVAFLAILRAHTCHRIIDCSIPEVHSDWNRLLSTPTRKSIQPFVSLAIVPLHQDIKIGRRAAVTSTMTSPSPAEADSPATSNSKTSSNHINSDANIGNFAPVARIMKSALPDNAKIAKEAKECMQECVSEFISFITSEGMSQSMRNCFLYSLILESLRKVSARETQDRQRRRYIVRNDFTRIRKLLGSAQDLPGPLSRGKLLDFF
jgi:hypothetical protein